MAISNNELSTYGMGAKHSTAASEIKRKTTTLDLDIGQVKFATQKGEASVLATDSSISITNKSNGIVVNSIGTVVDGLFHIGRQPSDVRISTFWTFNNELLTTLPSTIYTPIPVLVYKEPAAVKHLAAFMSLVSSLV